MGTTFSKLFGNGSKKHNNGAEPGAGQSATLPRPTTSRVKVDVPKKSSSFRIPFGKKSKTPSPAVTPKIPPKNQENAPTPSPTPALNVIDVQIDEEAFKKSNIVETTVEKVTESVAIVRTELESVVEEIKTESEDDVENAVVKIQAGVRGFLTRKHIKEGSSPDKEIGSVSVPAFDNEKRIETPTPSSPLKTTFIVLEPVLQQEERPEASLEELEILKKVQEINQLLATDDDDDFCKDVLQTVQSKMDQSADTIINTVENVMNVLDESIHDAGKDDSIVIDHAFAEIVEKSQDVEEEEQPIQQEEDEVFQQISSQQVPIHVQKSPSIEEEEESGCQGLSVEAAAIRIQAAFRGYGVRKSLSREPSPGRERIDDEAKALEEAAAELFEPRPEEITVEQTKPEITSVIEPIVEAAAAQKEVEAIKLATESDEPNIPESESLPVDENLIVPSCIDADILFEMDNKLVKGNSEQILELDNDEFKQLEKVVSENIIAETLPDSVPEPIQMESEDVPEQVPIQEELISQIRVEPREQQPIASETVLPETLPEAALETVSESIPDMPMFEEEMIGEIESVKFDAYNTIVEETVENNEAIINFEPQTPETDQLTSSDLKPEGEPKAITEPERLKKEELSVITEPETQKDEESEAQIEPVSPMEEESNTITEPEMSNKEEQKATQDEPNEQDSKLITEPETPKKEEPLVICKPEVSEKETQQESPKAELTESQNLDNVIESLGENNDSLVMKIKIGVESQPEKANEEKDGGDESDDDVSASMPVNRESSPASSGNKKRNRNRNKNRKR